MSTVDYSRGILTHAKRWGMTMMRSTIKYSYTTTMNFEIFNLQTL